MCLVGFVKDGDQVQMVAVGSYIRDQATQFADIAFLVHDDFQGRGIGTFLLLYLMKIAKEYGIKGFTGDVLGENRHMLHIFHKSGCEIKTTFSDGIYHLEFPLTPLENRNNQ